MTDRTDSVTADVDPDTGLRRFWRLVARAPLAAHAVVASVFLVLLMPLVHSGPTWVSDEGAVLAQVEVIATTDSWSRVRPFSEIDPEGLTSPIHASTINGDQYYPYTKRPAYPAFLVPVRLQFGQDAVLYASLAGTILAALAGAQIAGLLSRRIRNMTFWVLAVGSPLFIYGYTVTAHTLAVAASTVAVLVVLQASNRRGILVPVVAGGSMFVAVLLRSEAVLFGVALAVAIIVVRPVVGRLRNGVLALAVAGSAATAHFGSMRWAIRVAGEEPVSDKEAILDGARFLSGMLFSLVAQNLGGLDNLAVLFAVVTTVSGSTLLVMTVHREPQNVRLQQMFAGASIAGSLMLAFVAPVVITGLISAMPLLVAGLVLVGRPTIADPRKRLILLTSLFFFVGIFVTQDTSGGGVQWGGRYLMLAVPMLVAVAVALLGELLSTKRPGRALLVSVLAIATVALSLNGVLVLRARHDNTQNFNRRIGLLALEATYEDGRRPVIFSSQTHIGRHVWRTLDEVDYFLVPAEKFDVYLRRLAGEDLTRFGVFGDWDDEREKLFKSVGYVKLDGTDPPFVIVVRRDM